MASNGKGDMGVTTLSGDVLLQVWTDVSPDIAPVLRIICNAGGRREFSVCNEPMVKDRRPKGEAFQKWHCPNCKRVIRLMDGTE